jgi:hypothetical protein
VPAAGAGACARGWTLGLGLGLGLLGAALQAAAQPPVEPVLAGLWEVQSLLTVERRDARAGEVLPPPQSRQYRICIGPQRARAPMLPPRLPRGTELVFKGPAYEGSFDLPQTEAGAPRRQVDFSWRRLSATAFEGSHDVTSPARVARLQYFAAYLGADCGATRPSAPSDTGEP